ncbi:MAG: hypothetical protein KZQ59_12855 [Candidatus Thiodiazotropha sp. (ex Lucinoma aequizonata)]|nr:hypothetical protein [Candidatus Thiodiazotropha sp. (ex Lucinoma aequizonata)]
MSKGNHQLKPRKFIASYRKQMNPGVEAVKSAIDRGALIVDNCSKAEFLGIYGGGGRERAGSLPQAIHLNYDCLTVNGSGKLHLADNLRRIYNASQVSPWMGIRSTTVIPAIGLPWVGSSLTKSWAISGPDSMTDRHRSGPVIQNCLWINK